MRWFLESTLIERCRTEERNWKWNSIGIRRAVVRQSCSLIENAVEVRYKARGAEQGVRPSRGHSAPDVPGSELRPVGQPPFCALLTRIRFMLSCRFRIPIEYSHHLQLGPSHGNIASMEEDHSPGVRNLDIFSSAQTLPPSSHASYPLIAARYTLSRLHFCSLFVFWTRVLPQPSSKLPHMDRLGRSVGLGTIFWSFLAEPKIGSLVPQLNANPPICSISTSESTLQCTIAAFQGRRTTQDDGIPRP